MSINSGVFDYNNFGRVFKKKKLLMGLGNHKTLDYLSLSLNLPICYNPHTVYSTNYTKSV